MSKKAKTIIFCGNAASGKSSLIVLAGKKLTHANIGFQTTGDRQLLIEAVLQDTKDAIADKNGHKKGQHSILLDGTLGNEQVHVTDGVLLNQVHQKMAEMAVGHNHGVLLMEWAIGQNALFREKEPLRQDAGAFVGFLFQAKGDNQILVLELQTPFEKRLERNKKRPDPLADETFQAYFADTPTIFEAGLVARLPENIDYYLLGNNGQNGIEEIAGQAWQKIDNFLGLS